MNGDNLSEGKGAKLVPGVAEIHTLRVVFITRQALVTEALCWSR